MITLFNRKELLKTGDVRQQAEVMEKLDAAGIDYLRRASSLTGRSADPGRPHSSDFGMSSPEEKYTYTFYVRKEDYENACHVIGNT